MTKGFIRRILLIVLLVFIIITSVACSDYNQNILTENSQVNKNAQTTEEKDITGTEQEKESEQEEKIKLIDITEVEDQFPGNFNDQPIGTDPMEGNWHTQSVNFRYAIKSDGVLKAQFVDSYFKGNDFVVVMRFANTLNKPIEIPRHAFHMETKYTTSNNQVMPSNFDVIKLGAKEEKKVELVFKNLRIATRASLFMGTPNTQFGFDVYNYSPNEKITDALPVVKNDLYEMLKERRFKGQYWTERLKEIIGDGQLKMTLNSINVLKPLNNTNLENKIRNTLYLGKAEITIANTSDSNVILENKNFEIGVINEDRTKIISISPDTLYKQNQISINLPVEIKPHEIKTITVPVIINNNLRCLLIVKNNGHQFIFQSLQNHKK